MPRLNPLYPYVGCDYGKPEPALPPGPSPEMIELRDARNQIAMLSNRVQQLEGALRTCHRVLQPYATASRTTK